MLREQILLIIDSRGSESPHYQNIVEQNSDLNVINVDEIEKAGEIIEKYEPDLILACDNFDKSTTEICIEIRSKKCLCRSTLFVLSEDQSPEKNVEIIKAGADESQSININKEELSSRIFTHLRQQKENSEDSGTKLPVANTIYKAIKRNLEPKNTYALAVMHIDIDNFISYREIYGDIAAEKLIKTFIAIIKTSVNEKDFFGQLSETEYIILTTPEKAEKIATFLTYSFDVIAPKFYSNEDTQRGYLILSGDDKIGRRIPFVSVSIGITSNQYKNFDNYQEALTSGKSIQKLAKTKIGSSWVDDRPEISAGDKVEPVPNKILIIEKDAALAYLLSTTLEMRGYIVETLNNLEEIFNSLETNPAGLILIDIEGENSFDELAVCRYIKDDYPCIKVIVSSTSRDKEKVLDAGADLYMPKPYELMSLFTWVDRFFNNEV